MLIESRGLVDSAPQAPSPQSNSQYIDTFGGAARCPRCQAKSKRSGLQCRRPAMKGKRVCRTHGGASTGPRTSAGRQRCAEAKTVHGRETRAKRAVRAVKLKELREIEVYLFPPR